MSRTALIREINRLSDAGEPVPVDILAQAEAAGLIVERPTNPTPEEVEE